MSYKIGSIEAWQRGDTIPTTAEGGYAGAASTWAAISRFQDSVDALTEKVETINIGVGSMTATTYQGLTTLTWSENVTGGSDGGDGGGTVAWGAITGKPSEFPPEGHTHSVQELELGGTPNDRRYLRGDGTWETPGNGAVATGVCLRLYASGIEVHTNSGHVNNAVTGFGEDGSGGSPYDASGRLIIKHSAPGPIIAMSASPDETLVKLGVSAGLSGGSGTTVVQFVKDGSPVDLRDSTQYASISGPYSNLWISWINWNPNAGRSTVVEGGS